MDKVTVSIRSDTTLSAKILGTKVIDKGTTNYNKLTNKPTLNGVEIIGDKTSEDYGITSASDYSMLQNLPAINEHILTSGENTLASLGIGRASSADINKLF